MRKLTVSSYLLVSLLILLSNSLYDQQAFAGPPPPPPTPEPIFIPPQAPPTAPTPPPVVVTPPPNVPPPLVFVPQIHNNFINPISVPLDVIDPIPSAVGNIIGVPSLASPMEGVSQVNQFPGLEDLKGPTDFIFVEGTERAFTRESPYLVNLHNGTVLASVKRPSALGMINTPLGEVSLAANSDAFVSYESGVLRIRNIDALSQTLRVQLDKGPFSGHPQIFSIRPGYELTVADHKLTRLDLRPSDGILRRSAKLFADGFAGINQYHVQSALQQSAIVLRLGQQDPAKSHRVLADMSRMAAVLNQVNGAHGYAAD